MGSTWSRHIGRVSLMASRAALHLLLDQVPETALARVEAVLAEFAENDELTAEDEASIEAGMVSADAGRVIPADSVYAQIDAMLATKSDARQGA